MPPHPSSPIQPKASLAATALSCSKGDRLLFQDLSFSVKAGEGLELTGPNGVGKTSLLRILAGLSRPDAGSIRFEGLGETPERGAIEFLAVRDGLKPALTAIEHLSFWAGFAGLSTNLPELITLLSKVGLAAQADLPASALSSGQKRRLGLARAMLQNRPVLLMDEPLNALDVEGQGLLRAFIETRLQQGAIAVIATHQSLGITALGPLALGRAGA